MSQFTETTYQKGKPRVDVESGIIHGVKLLGYESKNGRTYKRDAVRRALPLYEGAKAFLDHPNRSDLNQDRSFRDWSGIIQEVTESEDGAYGDLKLRKKSPHFEEICEAASDFWESFGMSHVADGEFSYDGDQQIIEDINAIMSVDIVCSPATTNGLYESIRKPKMAKKTKTKTIRKIIEDAPANTRNRSVLMEMIDEAGEEIAMEPVEVSAEPEAAPEDAIMDGLLAAIAKKVQDADPETLKKVLGLLELGTDIVDVASGTSDGGGSEGGEGGEETEQVKESARRMSALQLKMDRMEAKNALLESGRKPTDVRVRALASATEKDRKALLESWAPEESKGSFRRPDRSPPAEEYSSGGDTIYESKFDAATKRAEDSLQAFRR